MAKRHKRPFLILRIGNLAKHLINQLSHRRELVFACSGLIVNPHAQLELVDTEMRVMCGCTGDVAVVEADTDRTEARVDVECERFACVERAAGGGEGGGDFVYEDRTCQTTV